MSVSVKTLIDSLLSQRPRLKFCGLSHAPKQMFKSSIGINHSSQYLPFQMRSRYPVILCIANRLFIFVNMHTQKKYIPRIYNIELNDASINAITDIPVILCQAY